MIWLIVNIVLTIIVAIRRQRAKWGWFKAVLPVLLINGGALLIGAWMGANLSSYAQMHGQEAVKIMYARYSTNLLVMDLIGNIAVTTTLLIMGSNANKEIKRLESSQQPQVEEA